MDYKLENMEFKDKWSDKDFEQMCWHDSTIYSISFPFEDLLLKFDMDYILEWKYNEESEQSKFYIYPCNLIFYNVLNLSFDLNFEDETGIYISEIERKNPILSPNKKYTIWNYRIITDKGDINFTSTGFEQIALKTPIWSDEFILKR